MSTRSAQKARTRERLLASAAEAFAERGFSATSLEEVAARASLTKGAVYANFANKDDLFLSLLEWFVDRRLASLAAALPTKADPRTQATGAASWVSDFLADDPQWSLLFFEFWLHAARRPDLRERYAGYRRQAGAAVARLLSQRASALGVMLPMPAERLARIILALVSGVALERLVEPDAIDDQALGAALTRLVEPA